MIENFIGTKNKRNFLEELKRKFHIFIKIKNIFNSFIWLNTFSKRETSIEKKMGNFLSISYLIFRKVTSTF